ncbi:DUF2948 family protein [Bauldia sp.]|uniref:DUF2948 family protein n=1 Tax=Bauldia sp. TaxID=2575872 RepID=UPI003BAC0498
MQQADILKLAALDQEDLSIVSAHVQDAVMKVGDLSYLPQENRFMLVLNRFIWERVEGKDQSFERRRAALIFDRVTAAKTSHLRRDQPDAVLSLLAIQFEPADAPAGQILLQFAGGAAVQLDVECIEARLADLGPAWATSAKPTHDAGAA